MVAVVAGLIWGFYTFFYKQVILPKQAPVNISMNFALKKTGTFEFSRENANDALIAIEVQISATDPSSMD